MIMNIDWLTCPSDIAQSVETHSYDSPLPSYLADVEHPNVIPAGRGTL